MHDIKSIRDNPQAFDAGLKRRGLPPAAQLLASIEGRRLAINRVLESWRAAPQSGVGQDTSGYEGEG